MLKKTIQYKDFNGDLQHEDLYFHISVDDLFKLIDLEPRINAWRDRVTAASSPDDLGMDDVRELLQLIKALIEVSYGQRSEDGKRFYQEPEFLRDLKASGGYDELLIGMFDNGGEAAVEFLQNILPDELIERLNQAAASSNTETVELPAGATTGGEMTAVKEEVPAWIREDRDPTNQEMLNMTQPQLADAYRRKLEKKNA